MTEQTQQPDDFAAIAKPIAPAKAPKPVAAPIATPGDDFAHIAKPHDAGPKDDLAPPSMHDLASSNPKNEGLYHMKDADGHSYAIPYSNVEAVPDFRSNFATEKEAQRYEQDRHHENSILSPVKDFAGRVRGKINDLTEPTYDYENSTAAGVGEGDLGTSEMLMNIVKRGVRGTVGLVDLPPTIFKAFKDLASRDEKVADAGEEQLWHLLPHEMAIQAIKGYNEDRKKDPQKAIENITGDVLAAYATGKLVEGSGGALKAAKETVGKAPEAVKTAVARKLAGTGEGFTKREVAEQATANKETARKAREEYDPEYKQRVTDTEEANTKAQQDFEKAKQKRQNRVTEKLKRSETLQKAKTRVFQHINDVHDAAVNYFNEQYDNLAKQTSGARVELSPLTEAVETAKLRDLADPITKVPVFEDILKKSKGEAGEGVDARPPANWDEMSLDERNAWRDEQLTASGATYRYLLGKYRQIGKLMKSPSLPEGVRTGLANVRNVIETMQTQAAKLADEQAPERYEEALAEWEKDVEERGADKAGKKPEMPKRKASRINYSIGAAYRNFAESYRDPNAIGTKIVNAPTAERGTALLLKDLPDEDLSDAKRTLIGKEGAGGKETHATQWAGRNAAEDSTGNRRLNTSQKRRQTSRLIDNLRKAQADFDAVPDPGSAPKLKLAEPPDYEPPQEEGYSEEKLKNRREEQINRRVAFYSSPGFRIGARGLTAFGIADIVAKVLGFHEGVALTAGGVSALSYLVPAQIVKLLTDPAIQERMLSITAKDREVLAKLPANQRAVVEQNIINMERVGKQKGLIPKDSPVPLANFAKQDIVKAKAEAAKPKPEPPPEEPPPATAPKPSGPNSPALPGMEGAVAEQEAAAHKTETQRQEAEASLATPKDDISRATGEMERNSPLFRDSEASGQGGLFNQPEAEPRNNVQPSRRLEDLKVDPKRFQYKLGGNKAGVTDALSDAKWNQQPASPIHIWEDPEDGNEYVVNGHHRYDLAQKGGAERINVEKWDNKKIKTAAEARHLAALINIGEGNGTSIDAAKFFRDSDFTYDDLKKEGISLKKSVANEGLSLTKLNNDLFDQVVDGRIDPSLGAAIGDATESPAEQEAILKDVRRREKQGHSVSAAQIKESARLIKQSPTFTETTQDLFGNHEEERNLFLEMGEVSEYIQKELADEKRIFKRVATKGASEQLAKGKNVINPEENAKIAQRAAQLRELYMKRSAQTGPIHAALQEAAERLAEGGKPNEIKQDALDEIREHLEDELGTPE